MLACVELMVSTETGFIQLIPSSYNLSLQFLQKEKLPVLVGSCDCYVKRSCGSGHLQVT